MKPTIVRVALLLILIPCVAARLGGQSGPGKAPPTNTESPYDTRPQKIYIAGNVVMENGSPPPAGAVIELNCHGSVTRETAVESSGRFNFQLGENSKFGQISADLSQGIVDPLRSDSDRSVYDASDQYSRSVHLQRMPSDSARQAGCSLRVALKGYRSSELELGLGALSMINEVGTIILFPLERVRGSVVSATTLLAPKAASKDMEKATRALGKNNAAEAETLLKSAISLYPKYAEAWYRLGKLYQNQQRTTEAKDAFTKSLECDKLYVYPYVGLAWILAGDKKWEEAADLAEEALALDPISFPDMYYLSAMAYYNIQDMVKAQERAQQLQQLNAAPRFPKTYLILASIFESMNNTAGSAEQLRNYLKYAPGAPDADLVRARLQEEDRPALQPAK